MISRRWREDEGLIDEGPSDEERSPLVSECHREWELHRSTKE